MDNLKCNVCGSPAKGVCASQLGAISFAYCENCLKNNAEPYGLLVYELAEFPDAEAGLLIVINGTLKVLGKTKEQLYADIEEYKRKPR